MYRMYGRPPSSSGSDDDWDSSSDNSRSGGLPTLMTMDTIGTAWKHESSTSSSSSSSPSISISDDRNADMTLDFIGSDNESEEIRDGYRRSKRMKLTTQGRAAIHLYRNTRDPAAVSFHKVPHTIRADIDTDSDSNSDNDTDTNGLYETDNVYYQTDAYIHSEITTDANVHFEMDNVGDVPETDEINAKAVLGQQLSLPNNSASNEPSSATDDCETIFQREIVDKDPKDPLYGDGFEIDRMFGPMLTGGEIYFHLQWRKGLHSGVGLLEATAIYKKWPKVALKFYKNHYGED